MAETYTAEGLFVTGFTVDEVLAIQAQAKKDVLAGRVITNYGNQGTSVGKQFAMPPGKILAECAYALKELDSDTYGLNRTGRRVHANFSESNPL